MFPILILSLATTAPKSEAVAKQNRMGDHASLKLSADAVKNFDKQMDNIAGDLISETESLVKHLKSKNSPVFLKTIKSLEDDLKVFKSMKRKQ